MPERPHHAPPDFLADEEAPAEVDVSELFDDLTADRPTLEEVFHTDQAKFDEFHETYRATYPDYEDVVDVVFGAPTYQVMQKKFKRQAKKMRSLPKHQHNTGHKHRARNRWESRGKVQSQSLEAMQDYMALLKNTVEQRRDDPELLSEMWGAVDGFDNADMASLRVGILGEIAVTRSLGQTGVEFSPASRRDDVKGIDLFVGRVPVQIKAGSFRGVAFFKEAPTQEDIQALAATARARGAMRGNRGAGRLLLVPSNRFDAETGDPKPDLVRSLATIFSSSR